MPGGDPLFHKKSVRSPRCPQILPEHPQYPFRILPGLLHLPHNHAVPAEGVPAQFIKILHKSRSDWVKVNVSNKFQKVDVLLAQNGLKTVLEKVPVSAVRSIEPQGITGQETPHDGGDRKGLRSPFLCP